MSLVPKQHVSMYMYVFVIIHTMNGMLAIFNFAV